MTTDETLSAILEAREKAPGMCELEVRLSSSGRWAAIVQPDGHHIVGIAEETPALFPDDAAFITLACNHAAELVREVIRLRAALAPPADGTAEVEEIRARHEAIEKGNFAGFFYDAARQEQAHDDRATLLRLLSEERARRVEVEGALGSLESLLPGPMAWLERWADHVGNCAGSHLCTCGLQLARYELFSAIQALPATHKDTQDE